MKVALMTSSFLPAIGGKEVVVHNLLKEYTHSQKINCRLVRTANFKLRLKHRFPYSYHAYPRIFKDDDRQIRTSLFFEKKLFGFDIIHLQGIYPLGRHLIKYKDRLNFKLVVTPQGEDIQKIPDLKYGFRLCPTINEEITEILSNADAVTAISPLIKKDIQSIYDKKIYDVPNGVYVNQFINEETKIAGKKLKQRLGIPDNTKIILAVGRNHPKKGFETLIKSMAIVERRIPDIKLIIVGRGTESLVTTMHAANLQKEIVLAGRIPKENGQFDPKVFSFPEEELIHYYLMSDVFVMSSWIEGFGNVTIEAMAAGKPIIATNLGGSADATGAVKDGDGGFLFSPGDEKALAEKLIRVLSDRDLRLKMGRRARDIAQQFDWSRVSARYEQIYGTILEKKYH